MYTVSIRIFIQHLHGLNAASHRPQRARSTRPTFDLGRNFSTQLHRFGRGLLTLDEIRLLKASHKF
jgi:hypothetical protein